MAIRWVLLQWYRYGNLFLKINKFQKKSVKISVKNCSSYFVRAYFVSWITCQLNSFIIPTLREIMNLSVFSGTKCINTHLAGNLTLPGGVIHCPMPWEPLSFTACCGTAFTEHCCEHTSKSRSVRITIQTEISLSKSLLVLWLIYLQENSQV